MKILFLFFLIAVLLVTPGIAAVGTQTTISATIDPGNTTVPTTNQTMIPTTVQTTIPTTVPTSVPTTRYSTGGGGGGGGGGGVYSSATTTTLKTTTVPTTPPAAITTVPTPRPILPAVQNTPDSTAATQPLTASVEATAPVTEEGVGVGIWFAIVGIIAAVLLVYAMWRYLSQP